MIGVTTILREIKEKTAQVSELILAGQLSDAEYRRLAGKYAALKEIEQFLLDPKNSKDEDI